ncbi:hypothetical protein DKX38_021983 [Salix brachista]|uniref:Leucine-rich repeat-containing N-terminal plant-type domain-containing protein n=1 Tax=Salix brachista TaxID=2182728 RepID=A0A5N5K1Q7_9ROSI|nr:hypothetical protein DKX38_021983 [Salix brachista]
MTSLTNLQLSANQLEGGIPRSCGGMCSLRELVLSSNNLSGPLPRFREISKLVSLDLSGNQLRGSLTDVTMLSSLRVLWITASRLDWNVSESIGSLSLLEELSVEGIL